MPLFRVIALLALVCQVVAGCTTSDDASDGTQSLETAQLPTTYWPSEPEVGLWYVLRIEESGICGADALTLPYETPGTVYYNDKSHLLGEEFDVSDPNFIPGYGRLTADGSIEFSPDAENHIFVYTAIPADTSDVPTCIEG